MYTDEVASGVDLFKVEAFNKLDMFDLVYKKAISRNAALVDLMVKKINNLFWRNKCLENILLETNNILEVNVKQEDKVKQ